MWYKNSSPHPHFPHLVLSKRPVICMSYFSIQWLVNILVPAYGPLGSLSKTLQRSLSASHPVQQTMFVCLSLHRSLISVYQHFFFLWRNSPLSGLSLGLLIGFRNLFRHTHGQTKIYQSGRKLGGSQSQSRHCGGKALDSAGN
jgi:hypothetical protein